MHKDTDGEKKIEATLINLLDFFSEAKGASNKLVIPPFQRNYAWDKKHVLDLLSSINATTKGYYIGNILIQHGIGSTSSDSVIDGQQRLATLFLVIRALRETLSEENKKQVTSLLFLPGEKIPRISFSRGNLNESFISIMTITDDEIGEQIFKDENSKKFFKNFLLIKDEIKKIDDLNAFFEKVKNVLFVVIKFDGGYDVNQLFEGLNSKGKILSTVQLTKNSLLGCAKDDKNTEEITQIWENIEGSFERKNVVWFDKFLRHQGFYKYGYVSNADLFVKIKKDLKQQVDFLEFSQGLETDALLYLKIRKAELFKNDIGENLSQSDWTITHALIGHLSIADLDQVFSVLFSMIKYAKINNPYARGAGSNFLVDLKRLWAFSILAKYLDTKPSLFERDFAGHCRNLASGALKDEDRKNFFTGLQKIVLGANKNTFILNLDKRIKITGGTDTKLTAKNNRNYVSQLLLLYLEDGYKFAVEGCSIEHIIPKGKKDGLQKWGIGKPYIKEVGDKSRYRLGNLTLLSKDNLGNESFNEKLKYYEKDGFSKNKLLKKYKELFNSENPSDAVDKRGQELGEVIYDLLMNIVNSEK